MAISLDTQKRMAEALTLESAGNEVVNVLQNAQALSSQSQWSCPLAVVATNVSTTVNFAALQVGDFLIHIPAVAGNAQFGSVATAGTAPFAAVVGDLYVALRAVVNPAPANIIL